MDDRRSELAHAQGVDKSPGSPDVLKKSCKTQIQQGLHPFAGVAASAATGGRSNGHLGGSGGFERVELRRPCNPLVHPGLRPAVTFDSQHGPVGLVARAPSPHRRVGRRGTRDHHRRRPADERPRRTATTRPGRPAPATGRSSPRPRPARSPPPPPARSPRPSDSAAGRTAVRRGPAVASPQPDRDRRHGRRGDRRPRPGPDPSQHRGRLGHGGRQVRRQPIPIQIHRLGRPTARPAVGSRPTRSGPPGSPANAVSTAARSPSGSVPSAYWLIENSSSSAVMASAPILHPIGGRRQSSSSSFNSSRNRFRPGTRAT